MLFASICCRRVLMWVVRGRRKLAFLSLLLHRTRCRAHYQKGCRSWRQDLSNLKVTPADDGGIWWNVVKDVPGCLISSDLLDCTHATSCEENVTAQTLWKTPCKCMLLIHKCIRTRTLFISRFSAISDVQHWSLRDLSSFAGTLKLNSLILLTMFYCGCAKLISAVDTWV